MTDTPRRKGPPSTARNNHAYWQMRQQHKQGNPKQQRPAQQPKHALSAQMGIKSGMTVEDLKRLTQQRMQQSAGGTPAPSTAPPPTPPPTAPPSYSSPAYSSPAPTSTYSSRTSSAPYPKPGMSVQELKQLTNMRLQGNRTTAPPATKRSASVGRPSHDFESLSIDTKLPRNRSRSSQSNKPSDGTYLEDGDSQSLDDDDESEYDRSSLPQDLDAYARSNLLFDNYASSDFQVPPPPPPINTSGASNNLPSWSPPAQRSKKIEAANVPPASFYSQPWDEGLSTTPQDLNMITPPGLPRRPSMTVPWQVAESVLLTPQAHRKTARESEEGDLKPSAAEVAAELNSTSLAGSGRGSPLSASPGASMRRSSLGNAAEFFKFRRRSKSRLSLARDAPTAEVDSDGVMPGIDERHLPEPAGVNPRLSFDSSSDEDIGASTLGDEEDVVQITGGYDDEVDFNGSFASFYQATNNFPIPPPPPSEDEDTSSLPRMSPSSARLRKAAELARRRSLSEDKVPPPRLGTSKSSGVAVELSERPPSGLNKTPRSAGKTMSPRAGIVRQSSLRDRMGRSLSVEDAVPPVSKEKELLEKRMAALVEQVAECAENQDMQGYERAMDELDTLRDEHKNSV